MAGLEEIAPRVVIEGVQEAQEQLRHLGEVGAEAFARIIESAAGGNFAGLVTLFGGHISGAFTQAAQAIGEFVDEAAAAVETLSNLATATGMTIPEIEGLKDAFASVGISTNGFERAVGRLAITIGNDWASIQQVVRTSADQQQGAMLHMQETAFGVEKAYHSMSEALDNAGRSAAHNSLAIQQSSIGLRQAMNELSDFSLKSQANSMSMESASLSLKRAQLNLMKDQGYDVSAEEKALKIEADKVAISEAQLRVEEASNKKMREGLQLEELQLKVKKAQQEESDAAHKRDEDAIKASERIREAEMNIKKEQLARREAAEKLHEMDLKDIPAIARELENVAQGQKKWDDVINHTEISAQNLTKAMILAAAGGSNQPPKAMDVYKEMSSVFAHMGDSADAMNKKLEIVQHTMGAGFRSGQASAAQLLAILERGPEALEKFKHEAEEFQKTSLGLTDKVSTKGVGPNDVDTLKEYNSAWSSLAGILEQVKGHFAAIFAGPMTHFLEELKHSLEDTNGAFHHIMQAVGKFVELLTYAGSGVARFVGWLTELVEAGAKKWDLDPVRAWMGVMIALLAVVAPIPTALIAIAAAATWVYDHWDVVVKLMKGAWDAFVKWWGSTWTGQLISGTIDGVKKIGTFFTDLWASVKSGGAALMEWWDSTWIGKIVNGIAAAVSKVKEFMLASGAKPPSSEAGTPIGPQQADATEQKRAASELDQAGREQKDAADKLTSASTTTTDAAKSTTTAAQTTTTAAQTLDTAANNSSGAASNLKDAANQLSTVASSMAQWLAGKYSEAPGKAEGGLIRGSGTPTSDQAGLFALSDGEYVVKSAAVSHYGSTFFEALNNLAVGGFATGGIVGGVSIPRSGEKAIGATSILNLTIDGHQFNGLKAPEHVASKLKTYAVTRQSSSAGPMPTWMR